MSVEFDNLLYQYKDKLSDIRDDVIYDLYEKHKDGEITIEQIQALSDDLAEFDKGIKGDGTDWLNQHISNEMAMIIENALDKIENWSDDYNNDNW